MTEGMKGVGSHNRKKQLNPKYWNRLQEEFKSCSYKNSGAYSAVECVGAISLGSENDRVEVLQSSIREAVKVLQSVV